MEELRRVLYSHAEWFPETEPVDAVKLLYQNEFGGGHMIEDPRICLCRLEKELEIVPQSRSIPLSVPIGNGKVRVNLSALNRTGLSAACINEIFVQSAELTHGDLLIFEEKLELLLELSKGHIFKFTEKDMADYLKQYKRCGYPAVSHSHKYRAAYSPAYRVVLDGLLSNALKGENERTRHG